MKWRSGRRNYAYAAFLVLMLLLGAWLEVGSGSEAGAGTMVAVLLCGVGSLGFLLANAALVLVALAKGRMFRTPLISCALSLAVIAAILAFESVP